LFLTPQLIYDTLRLARWWRCWQFGVLSKNNEIIASRRAG